MAFLSLEDETGEVEGVIFPKDFEKIKNNYLYIIKLYINLLIYNKKIEKRGV